MSSLRLILNGFLFLQLWLLAECFKQPNRTHLIHHVHLEYVFKHVTFIVAFLIFQEFKCHELLLELTAVFLDFTVLWLSFLDCRLLLIQVQLNLLNPSGEITVEAVFTRL